MKNWEEIPEIDLYSDGGAEPNPGNGGFGVIMSYKGKRKEFFNGYRLTTNNRMELMGVIYGLERLKIKSKVNVYTDSKYVIDGIQLGWAKKWRSKDWFRTKSKKAINHDLWAKLLDLIDRQEQVEFHWVKGHNGHPENERCDELAGIALKSENLLEDERYEPALNAESSKGSTQKITYESKAKIKKEGDACRKCGIPVIKRQPKKRKTKAHQSYYFDYYLYCTSCKAMYMVEEASHSFGMTKTRKDRSIEHVTSTQGEI